MPIASGKPYYIVNLSAVRANYLAFRNAIQKYGRRDVIAYSIKANYDPEILKILGMLGAYMEVCSDFEYKMAIRHANAPRKVIINGFQPNYATFVQYLENGALIILGSLRELEYIKEIQHPVQLGLRLNLDYIKRGDQYFMTHSRFGISPSDPTLQKILENPNIQITCLQCHFAGNTRAPNIYHSIVQELCQIITFLGLKNVQMLDIGGGYKVGKTFWTFDDYVEETVAALHEAGREDLTLIYEPGNSIVRDSCTYHVSVIEVVKQNGIRDVVINGTKYHCGQGRRNLRQLIRLKNAHLRPCCQELQRITGCTCKESDVICELKDFPEIRPRDELIIDGLGAYIVNEIPTFLLEKPEFYYL